MNRFKSFVAVLTAIMLLPATVFAGDNSLTINSKDYIASFAIYKVADSELKETPDFALLNMDYSAIETAEDMDNAADTMLNYIGTNSIEPLNTLSAQDSVTFDSLESGLYFVQFVRYNSEITMDSFLIMLPYYDSVSGSYLTDVVVNAKVYAVSGGGGGGGGGGTGGGDDGEDIDPPGDSQKVPSSGGEPSDKAEIRIYKSPEGSGDSLHDTGLIPRQIIEEEEITLNEPTTEPVSEPGTEPATRMETTTTATEQTTAAPVPGGTLPKTGGDKTVILCYYAGAVAVFIGAVILFVNNKKPGKSIN